MQPGVEHFGCFRFVAWEEVSVAVEGDRDGAVAHVGAQGFDVDSGGDHVGGVGVAAFVEANPGKAGRGPLSRGACALLRLDGKA